MTTAVQNLLKWMGGCLKVKAPGVLRLGELDLEDHLTDGRKHLWRDIVPANPPPPPKEPTDIMQANQPPEPPATPPKKESTQAEI